MDTTGRQRKRTLAQHMNPLLQRAKNVRLVQVVRCGYDDCVELVRIEKLVYVGEDVRDVETLRESTGLWTIVVAYCDELRPAHARQQRQMRKLCNRTRTNKSEPNVGAHPFTRLTVVPE
jgi:hypothetical protein